MRLDVRHRLKPPASPVKVLARHAWKLGLGAVVVALLTARGAGQTYTHPHALATSVVPTSVPCGDIKLDAGSTDTATWTATSSPYGTGSPYILPRNDPNLPTTDPSNPNCLTAAKTPDEVHVPAGVKLVIDGSLGPVQIFSHGTGIFVNGGQLKTINTDATNTVIFDASPDVASWDGINISAADAAHRGNASLSFVSVQHALTAITITSGATSSPDNASYGLTVRNSGIGPSYFDGIDAVNTPILLTGRVDPVTLRPDGQFGTLNNIGSQGIKVTYDTALPNYPSVIPDKALDVENMTFGSSVPFGEITCVPLSPCAAGSIGNDAIQGNFVVGQQPVKLDNNSFFRAGSYGLDLANANNPMITNNIFTCNGSGSPKPVISCVGSGLRYSAIYLSNVTNLKVGAGSLNNNKGQQNGLDAIVLNGQVISDLPWQTPWNDPNPPATANPPHTLGYVVANGDLQLVSSKLTVKDGDVVKVKGGAILISSGSLDASSAGLKTFTSLRDNTVGLQACPSVFVQSCPSPLPANEWIGINLVGSTGNIANANILFPTKAIDISGGQASVSGPDGGAYGLVVSNSRLGPTFSDSVAVNATPVYISASKFCRIDTIPSSATYLQCIGAGPGDHGINASFTGNLRPAAAGGLKLLGNDFQGSTNEAILGTALGGRAVDIENDTVESAGTYGLRLASADNLTLKQNSVTGSGIGNPANTTTYAAIYLDGISKADFSGAISGNTGTGNGLDAIAFHGSTADLKPLNWKTVGASDALGYLIDGDLLVNGDLTLATNDYAPVLGGAITMRNGTFTATGSVLSSLKEQASHLPSCGSIFVPKVSGACPATAAGDWAGLTLDPGKANALTDSEIRYAVTGISVGTPTGSRLSQNLTLTRTNVRYTAADGIGTRSPLSISGGVFTGNAGRGIKVDLTGVAPSAAQALAISGHTAVGGSGQEGILAIGLSGHTVQVADASVDRAGTFGINLRDADHLTLTNNVVTNSAATYPAIYLNGFSGPFANIFGNKGAANGIDALAFHGTVTDDLVWQTARKTTDATQLLGYVLDNTLTMQPGHTLTVNAGDIVKVGNGGTLNLQGVSLRADDTSASGQKIFTSLTDNTAGVVACPSVLLPGCGPAAAGDWGGISLWASGANGTLVNASVRFAATAISISSGATSTYGSSSFGLVVSRSTLASTKTDGVFSSKTAISVTDSTISGGVHGVNADLTNAAASTALRLSANQFKSTSNEAILGQGLGGQPVWITDNRVQNALTFGVRLVGANQLVLRNNIVTGSGGGPTAGPGRYPAIYLNAVSADFVRNVRGNVGSGNGLDAIVMDGSVVSDLTWITPVARTSAQPLGYLLDGGLTLQGGTLNVGAGDVVKSLGGPITINGGAVNAAGVATPSLSALSKSSIFTSFKDNPIASVTQVDNSTAAAVSCPSIFAPVCNPSAGDWGGIVITNNAAGLKGAGAFSYALINYADTGIALNSGPISASPELSNFRLTVANNTTISNVSKDGINSIDTPFSIDSSSITNSGAHGVIASFFSPANCASTPSPCVRLNITGVAVTGSGQDGVIANGLSGQPTVISGDTVTDAGTYGIRLVGADQLTLTANRVRKSAPPPLSALRYPAIYLSSVKGDFEVNPGAGAIIQGNTGKWTGMDAVVFHGEATKKLSWVTAAAAPSAPLPVADVMFGYLLDGPLTVDGDFVTSGDIVKTINGGIKINGGSLQSVGTLFTSLKDNAGMSACQSVFIPSCPSLPAAGDWSGINIDATDSMFNSGRLLYASSGVTINSASLKVNNTLIAGLTGYAVTTTGTGSAQIDCASIHGNGGGISSSGGTATNVTFSNLFGNNSAGKDFTATVASTAINDWWGVNPPDPGQYSATYVNAATPLPQERPTLKAGFGSLVVTSDNTNANGNIGKGTLKVTLTFDRKMNVNVPLLVTFIGPGETIPHAVTGSWNSDNLSWTGTAPVDAATNSAGLNSLIVSQGTSCVPDGNNVMTSETGSFTLDFGKATVAGSGNAQNIGARSATFTDSVNPNGWSNPSTNPRTATYVFFQYRLDSGSYDATVIAGLQAGTVNPTGLLGYQVIGHGTAPVAVNVQVSQQLQPSTPYDYRAVAVDLNGISTGLEHPFTTLAAADHLSVVGAASTKAGDPYSLTVTARNPANQTVIDYPGIVSFSSSDPQWVAPSAGTLTSGAGTFIATLKTAGSQSITATDGVIGGLVTPITVNPAAAKTLSVAALATVTAGSPFNVTVTAKDAFGNTATSYTGTVQFSGGGSGATLPGPYTFTVGAGNDNGTHTFSGVILRTAGTQTITAADTVTSTITGSQAVMVNAAGAASLLLTYSGPVTHGVPFNLTVTAKDLYGNTATGYVGKVHFTSTDLAATLPGDYIFTAGVGGDNGQHVFSVKLSAAGNPTVTATDTVTATITGTVTVAVS